MNGGRWVTAQGTAGRGMRRDDRDAYFVFASLDLVNLHPFGKREQRIAFHHDLVSLSTQSDEFFWRAVYHPFSLSHQPHQFTDSPKSAMSRLMAHVQIWGNDELTEEFRFKNVLKELIEKTLQLTFAPNLDMSRLISKFTSTLSVNSPKKVK